MIEVGRLIVKLAGRDAGLKGVIVDILDEKFILIDGQVRRRKCNILHIEPLDDVVKIKKGASHDEVVKSLKEKGIEVKEKKAEKKDSEKTERPKKQRKQKEKPVKESKSKPAKQPKIVKKDSKDTDTKAEIKEEKDDKKSKPAKPKEIAAEKKPVKVKK